MNKDDKNADIEMYFKQIISLADLMIETTNNSMPNLLTIRDLAESGLTKAIS